MVGIGDALLGGGDPALAHPGVTGTVVPPSSTTSRLWTDWWVILTCAGNLWCVGEDGARKRHAPGDSRWLCRRRAQGHAAHSQDSGRNEGTSDFDLRRSASDASPQQPGDTPAISAGIELGAARGLLAHRSQRCRIPRSVVSRCASARMGPSGADSRPHRLLETGHEVLALHRLAVPTGHISGCATSAEDICRAVTGTGAGCIWCAPNRRGRGVNRDGKNGVEQEGLSSVKRGIVTWSVW